MFWNKLGWVLRWEEEVFSTWNFPISGLPLDAFLFLILCTAASPGCDWGGEASGGGDPGMSGCYNGRGPYCPGIGHPTGDRLWWSERRGPEGIYFRRQAHGCAPILGCGWGKTFELDGPGGCVWSVTGGARAIVRASGSRFWASGVLGYVWP
jgi:hypothetical protein